MSFSIEILGEQIIFKNSVVGAAIEQVTIGNVASSGGTRIPLTIKTTNKDLISMFTKCGGKPTDSGVFLEAALKESIIKFLEEAFQLAGMSLPPSEIYGALGVSKPSPTEPFEAVAATAETITAVHGFFGARGGAGAASGPGSLLTSQSVFLSNVAEGKQDEANALLTATPANTQTLLRTPGVFTDYSGRTFNCTAYEYAYWAKDTHMCRMLGSHMDAETKALMLERINVIEASGLSFQQNGTEHRSAHFDLTPLKMALQAYVDGYDAWCDERKWAEIEAAWMVVGKAQRNVPAYVANEYCRPDRSFYLRPEFNEETLPRGLTYYNWRTGHDASWFPLTSSDAGLGFGFALIRGGGRADAADGWRRSGPRPSAFDLAAVSHLDEVSTAYLTLLREQLNPLGISPGMPS